MPTRTELPRLVAPLWQRADATPSSTVLTFIEETGERATISAESLRASVARAAGGMIAAGVKPGDIVLIAIGHSRALIDVFLGAAAIGAAPAIAPYFTGRLDPAVYAERVTRMVEASHASLVVVSSDFAARLPSLDAFGGGRFVRADEITAADAPKAFPPDLGDNALAYVQFSSGSTGAQKAIAHTQRAMRIYLNAKAARDSFTADDVIISWLPLYHDLGLISGLLTPIATQVPAVLMSPAHWVRDPKILLQAVHEFRGSVSWMPNFALSHCARAVRDRDLIGIDLSSWRRLTLGAEIIRYESLREFAERFAPFGFRASALLAGYGMAENVEAATATHPDQSVRVDWVRRSELQLHGRATPAEPDAPDATPIVSCGIAMTGTEVKILGADGKDAAERNVGEILVRSTYCLSTGYYGRPDLTAAVKPDEWLHTGDLGYLAGGELHVCGRKKDLIIVGGHNVAPDDLEDLAGSVEGVAAGRVVAFGVPDERIGTDRIVIACELARDVPPDAHRTIEAEIRKRVVGALDVAVGEIRFVDRGWILKTSSGKLARSANRDKHLADKAAQGGGAATSGDQA